MRPRRPPADFAQVVVGIIRLRTPRGAEATQACAALRAELTRFRVAPHPGGNVGDLVRLGAGRATDQAGGWWRSSDWWEETQPWTNKVRAHEFGHLIGMYDEYEELAFPIERIHLLATFGRREAAAAPLAGYSTTVPNSAKSSPVR